jgi:hypothetical protein
VFHFITYTRIGRKTRLLPGLSVAQGNFLPLIFAMLFLRKFFLFVHPVRDRAQKFLSGAY